MGETRIPKYYALKKELVRKIEAEEVRADSLIQSERELMIQYQVSRITVRRAIDELVTSGFLYKIQGKGTYVKGDDYSQNLFAITSCTDDVKRLGRSPSKLVVSSEIIPADMKRARLLNTVIGEKLFRLERVTMADDNPLNYTITYLSHKLFPGIDEYDFNEQSLYELLIEKYQVKFAKSRRTIEAVRPEKKIAEYLEIAENMPVILFESTTYGMLQGREQPIENFKCYYRTDQYKFYIEQIK